ncbi:MAG TPA: ABC transporter substrate-binding protein [Alphaproteobacteria bacterium]|nr:ABC transporter substrate-binding protein [Alphaproteobacteria bacterium]
MRRTAWSATLGLTLAAGMMASFDARAEGQLVAVGWGGVWQDAYRKAVFEPFMKETGIKVVEEEFGGEYAKLTSQIEAGKVTWDVAAFESPQVIQGCDEGSFVKLDWDSMGGRDNQLDYAAHDCGIGSDVWSTVMAYDGDKIKDGPKTWADFWNVEKWPGKRGVYKDARFVLEIALVADGVAPGDIYKVLGTKEGMDRAFKKLDELKPHILWAESAADGMQRLLAGDVAMVVNFNARVTGAAKENNRNLVIAWPAGFWVGTDYWVQIAQGPNPDAAKKFLQFYSRPEVQAELVKHLSYGVPAKAAYDLMSDEVKGGLPTSPDKAEWAMSYSDDFWVEHQAAANERFNAWASQ